MKQKMFIRTPKEKQGEIWNTSQTALGNGV
jgi:hypothetical protein